MSAEMTRMLGQLLSSPVPPGPKLYTRWKKDIPGVGRWRDFVQHRLELMRQKGHCVGCGLPFEGGWFKANRVTIMSLVQMGVDVEEGGVEKFRIVPMMTTSEWGCPDCNWEMTRQRARQEMRGDGSGLTIRTAAIEVTADVMAWADEMKAAQATRQRR